MIFDVKNKQKILFF